MGPRPPRTMTLVLTLTKTLVLLVVVALSFGLPGGSPATSAPSREAPVQIEERSAGIERAMVKHQCSATGFGAGVIPGSALVRRDERVRQVSFDEGWAVFTGEAEGTLVAVCLGDVEQPTAPARRRAGGRDTTRA